MYNFRLFGFLLFVIFFSSCVQLNVYQTARTEGKGNLTISPMIEGNSILQNSNSGGNIGNATVPGGRVEISYGLSDNFDISANISSYGSLLSSLKYRILGNNDSPFAMAIMPGYEYQVSPNGGGADVSRLHFPILFSYFSSEQLGYFITPKYAVQVQQGSENISYPGLSAGINFKMSKINYTIGAGGYFPFSTLAGSTSEQIYQFGISARIPIINYKN